MSGVSDAILNEFLIESFENLGNISDELTRYEKAPDKDLLNAIYRKVHTLKGSASFLGFKNLEKVTHSSETILNELREGSIEITAALFDVILESFDICSGILKDIKETGNEPNGNYSEIIDKLNRILEDKGHVDNISAKSVNDQQSLRIVEDQKEASKPESKEEKPIETKEEIVKEKEEPKAPENKTIPAAASAARTSTADSTIRVNVSLLDKIMNIVGELVLNRNQILQFSKESDDSELNRLSQQLNVITTDLQTDIMTTRMQPVGSVFNKFERVIRDLARSQKKKIKLEIHGGETELDKSLLEMIKDPMTHLIRNAADHGLEKPEDRVKKGKSEEGKLIIKAYHEGGQVIIDIIDDGNGLSKDKIAAKAISSGVITPEEAQHMSLQKIHNLIFAPGFSTAAQVTNISGRGVGMDVVKSNIESIGGKVDVISTEGEGSTFKLKIPLTLAIVPALIVKSSNETFALPQKNLVELVLLEKDRENSIEKIHSRDFYRLRGELVPIFYLNKSLEFEPATDIDEDCINIVVMQAEGCVYGLVVDKILDTQEIVVKPLSPKVKNENVYAGATIMGDGKVAIIIDALGFYNMVNNNQGVTETNDLDDSSANDKRTGQDSHEILLCQLADGRSYGIPLCLVNRLEEFKSSNVEWSGDQPLIRYRDMAMPLVNVESHLKLSEKGLLERIRNQEEGEDCILYTIVIYTNGGYVGFVVDKIQDIAVVYEEVDDRNIDRKGLLGTLYLDESLISIIDIHTIISMKKIRQNQSSANVLSGEVLVADDSPLYRRIITDILQSHGLTVTAVKDGQAAYEIMSTRTDFSLLVTDIEMPNLDGIELTKKVRSMDNALGEIPIIAISTRYDKKDSEKGIKAGASSYLKKIDQDEFLNEVKKYLLKQ